MPPKGTAYQTDWICSPTSNVHIANHRDWFTTFTEFHGPLETVYFGSGSGGSILGIGDVELDITKALDQGRKFCKKVILRDVLFVPSFPSNVFGQLAGSGFNTDGKWNKRKVVDRKTGTTVGKIDEKARLPRLWLKKNRLGKSSLEKDKLYMINAWWSDDERARWIDSQSAAIPAEGALPYTSEEKLWLKDHFQGEFRFLRRYGLSIYNEEDREDGRAIVRSMMADDVVGDAGGVSL